MLRADPDTIIDPFCPTVPWAKTPKPELPLVPPPGVRVDVR